MIGFSVYNGSGSTSLSAPLSTSLSTSPSDCGSGSGVRSRSCTKANAGNVAEIAGIIGIGSPGRSLIMDARRLRDTGGAACA